MQILISCKGLPLGAFECYECFEDEYEKSSDPCFKEFLRKTVALKEMK